MSTFAQAVSKQELKGKTRTENGMVTRVSSKDRLVDLFFKWGASRNLTKDVRLSNFLGAFADDQDMAIRLLLWGRDIRGGAGERNYFREVLKSLAISNYDIVEKLFPKIVEVGRFDDLFVLMGTPAEAAMLNFYASQLEAKNGLAAKWAPREFKLVAKVGENGNTVKKTLDSGETKTVKVKARNPIAGKLKKVLKMNSEQYRKLLSSLTNVVEQEMCANTWSDINFSHVPSKAAKIYSKAFNRHDGNRYQQYLTDVIKGTNGAKINSGAIFPHDVLGKALSGQYLDDAEVMRTIAQWDALPNYIGAASVLPMVDVSGSMAKRIPDTSYTVMGVAVALGLYMADKNQGAFKDLFLTFSSCPQLVKLNGNVLEKLQLMSRADWGMSTDLERAFDLVLKTAIKNKIPEAEMPKVLLILSDMQFNAAVDDFDESALKMIKRKFRESGYEMPNIVFWNIDHKGGVPTKFDTNGVALVSGYSSSIMQTIVESIGDMNPVTVMNKKLMSDRYTWDV